MIQAGALISGPPALRVKTIMAKFAISVLRVAARHIGEISAGLEAYRGQSGGGAEQDVEQGWAGQHDDQTSVPGSRHEQFPKGRCGPVPLGAQNQYETGSLPKEGHGFPPGLAKES